MPNLVRINVYLPKDLKEKLRVKAFKLRRSIASLVREALEKWLKP